MRTFRENNAIRHPVPILDMERDGDAYLAELARRAVISHYDQSQQDAVLHWLN